MPPGRNTELLSIDTATTCSLGIVGIGSRGKSLLLHNGVGGTDFPSKFEYCQEKIDRLMSVCE